MCTVFYDDRFHLYICLFHLNGPHQGPLAHPDRQTLTSIGQPSAPHSQLPDANSSVTVPTALILTTTVPRTSVVRHPSKADIRAKQQNVSITSQLAQAPGQPSYRGLQLPGQNTGKSHFRFFGLESVVYSLYSTSPPPLTSPWSQNLHLTAHLPSMEETVTVFPRVPHSQTGGGAVKDNVATSPGGFSPWPTGPNDSTTTRTTEVPLYSCVLPDLVIAAILSERFLLPDCANGIIIDGLDCLFSASQSSMLAILLRVLGRRRYLFAVTMRLDYVRGLQEARNKAASRAEAEANEADLRELQWLEEMEESEYANLPEEERERIDRLWLSIRIARWGEELELRRRKHCEEEEAAAEEREREARKAELCRLEEERYGF
ncbi:unnamed protein product [Protopolystoma xenopodis]|uniref:Hydin adenylate kinase-like domain-containing protein n=1 Tax=Protopolystoma xenopodis TaxID=117903 RepID=A0A3S5B6U5_9PLAT|nr:unnamed protein product [Protopolystoma xenopodis]